MTKETQLQLLKTFENIKHITDDGIEFWDARELSPILGYERWENFLNVISKAKTSCANGGILVENHFRDATKKVIIGSTATKEVSNYNLSRYACYLIAQNGSPTKEAIAAAQMYFAVQTRKQEMWTQHIEDLKRIDARKKLTQTEKKFAATLWERNVDGHGIGEIRSVGDRTLFDGLSTRDMKIRMGIDENKPLADYLPTVTIKAKDLAAEMTTHVTKQRNLLGKEPIKTEHIINNSNVRNLLTMREIYPEKLPAEEDVNKIERKYKNVLQNNSQSASQIEFFLND